MKVAKIINEESELRLLRDKNKNKKIADCKMKLDI